MSTDEQDTNPEEVNKYCYSLVNAYVKTEEDVCKTFDKCVKRLYLKHAQETVEEMANQVMKMFVEHGEEQRPVCCL